MERLYQQTANIMHHAALHTHIWLTSGGATGQKHFCTSVRSTSVTLVKIRKHILVIPLWVTLPALVKKAVENTDKMRYENTI